MKVTQSFNAIYAAPKLSPGDKVPLIVDIHDGPEQLSTTWWRFYKTFCVCKL
jgi:dipeptidyl aminopeptidase/acylaminoacyl peptidase